jgi:hypothetical protein
MEYANLLTLGLVVFLLVVVMYRLRAIASAASSNESINLLLQRIGTSAGVVFFHINRSGTKR